MIDDLQFMNQKEDNYEISKEECMDLFAKFLSLLANKSIHSSLLIS